MIWFHPDDLERRPIKKTSFILLLISSQVDKMDMIIFRVGIPFPDTDLSINVVDTQTTFTYVHTHKK